jgi:hypothetical protein
MRVAVKKLAVLGAVLPALALSGCISFSGHFGTKIRVENIPRIEDGVTTREEVMSWFGPPSAFFNPTFLDVILASEEEVIGPGAAVLNDVYTYRYIENKTTLFFVPIFVAFLDTVAVAETLTIFFDENGRVEYHAYRRDVPRPGKDD